MNVSLPGRRVGTVVILVFAFLATLGTPALAHLPAISVPCGEVKALREAIEAANNSTTHPGEDTISLAAGCTYTVTDEYAAAGHGFPFITSTIRLLGNGATITRHAAAPVLRFFNIDPSGFLLIDRLTLHNGHGGPSPTHGGAISNNGDIFVTNSTFDGNTGGAVSVNVGAGASFIDTVFSDNRFTNGGYGGAVFNQGLAYFERATLVDNAASASTGRPAAGGAVYNGSEGEMTIYRSTLTDNFTNRSGGAISNSGDLLILDSTIDSNYAAWGGAISGGGVITISNSTIANNVAVGASGLGPVLDTGGALDLVGGTTSITHTTIAGNRAPLVGGIFNDGDATAITISNSILSNTNGNCDGAITDGGYNLGAEPDCPATFLSGPPVLSTLGMRGGATATMALGASSAARDRIPATGAGCMAKDQREFSRPFGSACDIGAVESQPPTAPGSFAASPSPNQGSLQLTWTAATDPDRDLMSYVIDSMDADDATWVFSRQLCCFTSTGWSTWAPEREGRITYRIRATDGAYTSAWVTSGQVVVDRTDPDAPSAGPDAAPEYTDGGGNRWFADEVTISFTPGSDPALPDGSAGSGITSTTTPQMFSTEGPFSATGNSTDAAGNVSADRVYAGNVDTGAPSVAFTSCPSSVILGSSQSIGWTASDTGSGVNGATSGSVALDTSAIGPHTSVTPTVADNVGHNATDTCDYDVIWDFGGFRAPLRPFPTLANVGSGQQVRVTFSLGGDQGLAVIESGYPVSAAIDCTSTAPLESGDPAVAAGPLTYSSQTGDYSYQWVTSKAWKGTCRQFILKLDDGTYHRANLRFK